MIIHFFPLPFLIGLFLLAIVIFILWRKKRSLFYLIATFLFGLYLLLLIDAVLFYMPPIVISDGPILKIENVRSILSKVNLIPLNFGHNLIPNYLFPQIYYNILLTVPFGFGINFLIALRLRNIPWIAAAVGCATELSQLLVSIFIVGGHYRGVDINDVLLNMAGVWLGYGCFRLTIKIFPPLARLAV